MAGVFFVYALPWAALALFAAGTRFGLYKRPVGVGSAAILAFIAAAIVKSLIEGGSDFRMGALWFAIIPIMIAVMRKGSARRAELAGKLREMLDDPALPPEQRAEVEKRIEALTGKPVVKA